VAKSEASRAKINSNGLKNSNPVVCLSPPLPKTHLNNDSLLQELKNFKRSKLIFTKYDDQMLLNNYQAKSICVIQNHVIIIVFIYLLKQVKMSFYYFDIALV